MVAALPAPWSADEARGVVEGVATSPGPVLIALQALQARYGYVHPDAVAMVAEVLNVSRAEVHGVLTYYHDLRTTPAPRAEVRLCVAEACQASGSRAVASHAEQALGVALGGETADGIALHPVYCLGNCALGPAALVDGRLVGRLTPASFDQIVSGLREDAR